MRIFFYEWKKLFAFRIFWIMLGCLLLVNGYIQIDRANDRYYTPESYRSFFAETADMSLSETQDYLNQLLEEQSGGDYTVYPMILIYDMLELSEECKNYPEYLDGIAKQAENMVSVSIWGGADTFSYRNIQKTPSAYASLTPQELPLAPSFGLENTFTSPLTDCIGIFLVFLVVCAVMLKDRERGIMPLLYAMPNGRQQLFLHKLAVAAVCTCAIVLLLFGENLCIGGYLYGLGDLSRPIQSVFGFYQCNLPISVGTYLILFFLLKIASYLLFTAVFSLICILAKNNLMIYGISGVFCGGSFLLYYCISGVSALNLLHFLNPVMLTQVSEIYSTYQNINLFGYPFSLKISALVFWAVVLIVSIGAAVWTMAKSRNIQYRTISLRLFHKKHIRVHCRFFYVCYRSLILQKGMILVLAAVFVTGMLFASFSRTYSNNDIYYENFTTQWEGEVTQDTLDFLTEKDAHYAEVEQQIEALQTAEHVNTFELNDLWSELNDRSAFERFRTRVEAIQGSEKDGELFYDTGYERLFGIDGNHEDMVMVLCMLLFLTLLLSPFAAQDRKTDMVKILFSTKSGKRGYWCDLALYSALWGAVISLVFTVPYIINIFDKYGTQGLFTPIQSIQAFSDLGGNLTVGGMILLLLAARTVFTAAVAVLISRVSSLCRSSMTAYFVNIGCFVLPGGLVLLGVNVLKYFGILPFVSLNGLVGMLRFLLS